MKAINWLGIVLAAAGGIEGFFYLLWGSEFGSIDRLVFSRRFLVDAGLLLVGITLILLRFKPAGKTEAAKGGQKPDQQPPNADW